MIETIRQGLKEDGYTVSLYSPGPQLRPEPRIHRAALPTAKRLVERVIRTLKEQCAHRHRFETLQYASRVIGDWIRFYNHRRPHQALNMKSPAEAFSLAT